MSPEPKQGARIEHHDLSRWYGEFVDAARTSPAIATYLERTSTARAQWRRNWEARGRRDDPAALFATLFPQLQTVRGDGGWTHPMCDDADELRPWLDRYHRGDPSDTERLVRKTLDFLGALESGGDDPHGDASCDIASHLDDDVPLAAITPGLSALFPERYVTLCRAWLRVLGGPGGRQLPGTIEAYDRLNAMALEWLERASRSAPSAALAQRPAADRLAAFCSWGAREKRAALSRGDFAVGGNRYKEWPPMW